MKTPGRKRPALPAPEPGRQYAALPYRDEDGLEILLVTSRETRRWVIPKGWPMKHRKPYAAAAREALEEAGVAGRVDKRPIGEFHYVKRLKNGAPLQCAVDVFPLKVTQQRAHWLEQNERTARWFSALEAAEAVEEDELKALIESFAESIVHQRHARRAERHKNSGYRLLVRNPRAPRHRPRHRSGQASTSSA